MMNPCGRVCVCPDAGALANASRKHLPEGAVMPHLAVRSCRRSRPARGIILGCAAAVALAVTPAAAVAKRPFLDRFQAIDSLGSTVPANGDVNPYGVAIVPRTVGDLSRGDVLVSNFNDAANAQGTGTTIVDVPPDGATRLFAAIDPAKIPGGCPGGIGLTTALSVLRSGYVIVGSLPTTDGSAATAAAGCLLVLDPHGKVVERFASPLINGPWDMTAVEGDDRAALFVTNVLNGTVAANGSEVDQGTVLRIRLRVPDHGAPRLISQTVVANGFPERTDPSALVIGPTGVALGDDGVLYVADTLGNRIAAVPRALDRSAAAAHGGTTVTSGGRLNGPLGLAVAPQDDILTTNGGDGKLVETTPRGVQVRSAVLQQPPNDAGVLFGVAVARGNRGIYFVNDGDNTLGLFH
jgi:sugar lactone lactonase YvrE